MTTEEMAEFDRLMRSYYRNKASKLEQTNSVLWGMAIDLVRAIAEAESDGSSIGGLKVFGEERTAQLRQMLEREQAP